MAPAAGAVRTMFGEELVKELIGLIASDRSERPTRSSYASSSGSESISR